MSNITDRELLAFCSLAKLKLEFSQYKKEKQEKNETIIEYQTIRQLIKEELAGQEIRRKNSAPLIVELREIEEGINEKIKEIVNNHTLVEQAIGEEGKKALRESMENSLKSGEYQNIISEKRSLELQEEWKRYHEKVKEIRKEKINIGMIYDDHEEKKNPFLYKEENDLRGKAPMIMEYYDTPSNEESKFMTEWEIVYAGDSYAMGKHLYEETIRKSTYSEEEKLEKLKNISTRQQMKDRNMKKQAIDITLTMLDFAVSIYLSKGGPTKDYHFGRKRLPDGTNRMHIFVEGQEPVLIEGKGLHFLKHMNAENMRNYSAKQIEINKEAVGNAAGGLPYSVDRASDLATATNGQIGILEKMIPLFVRLSTDEKVAETYLENLEKESVPYRTSIELNGVNVVVLRKKMEKSFQYVLALEDTVELKNVDEQLKNGLLPDDVQILINFMNEFIGMFGLEEFKPILTGVKNAGKLATVLGLMLSDSELKSTTPIRCFYSNKPYNLAGLKFFTAEDINSFLQYKAIYNSWDLEVSPLVNRTAVLIVASFFTSPSIVLVGALNPWTVLAYFIVWVVPIIKNHFKKEELEKIVKHLEEKNIIEGRIADYFIESYEPINAGNAMGTVYRYNKIKPIKIGNVNEVTLKGKYDFEHDTETTLSLDLASYLQMWYYKNIKKYEIIKDKNYEKDSNNFRTKHLKNITYGEEEIIDSNYAVSSKVTLGGYHIYIEEKNDKIEVKRILEKRETTKHNTQKVFDSDGNYVYDEIIQHDPQETEVPKTAEDKIGELLVQILIYFKNIQENSEKNLLSGYYLKGDKPEKIESFRNMEVGALQLEYSRKGKLVDIDYSKFPLNEKEVKTEEYSYFPYVSMDGNISTDERKKVEIRDEYVGSFLRSIYKDPNKNKYQNEYNEPTKNGQYYDRTLSPVFQSSEPLGSSIENINTVLKDEIINKGKKLELPHYKAVVEKLNNDQWEELLKKFWEVEEQTIGGEKKHTLILGHLNGKNFDEKAITYSYNKKDQILSRAVSINLTNKFKSIVEEAALTQVADGATLTCSEGEGKLNLKVTSQEFSYLEENNLEATSEDKIPKINILPLGTVCRKRKKEPCNQHISLGEWSEIGKKSETSGMLILLKKSKIGCMCGGEITIEDPNTKIKSD